MNERIGALFATVPSNGSTNQSDFALELIVRALALLKFQDFGEFRQVSGLGRPGMDVLSCPQVTTVAHHKRAAAPKHFAKRLPIALVIRKDLYQNRNESRLIANSWTTDDPEERMLFRP